MVVNSVMNSAGEQVPRRGRRADHGAAEAAEVPSPRPRGPGRRSAQLWPAQAEVGEVLLELDRAVVEGGPQVAEAGRACWATNVPRGITANRSSDPDERVARLREQPPALQQVGDRRRGRDSSPMMTGTSTAEQCPNTRRNTRRRRPPEQAPGPGGAEAALRRLDAAWCRTACAGGRHRQDGGRPALRPAGGHGHDGRSRHASAGVPSGAQRCSTPSPTPRSRTAGPSAGVEAARRHDARRPRAVASRWRPRPRPQPAAAVSAATGGRPRRGVGAADVVAQRGALGAPTRARAARASVTSLASSAGSRRPPSGRRATGHRRRSAALVVRSVSAGRPGARARCRSGCAGPGALSAVSSQPCTRPARRGSAPGRGAWRAGRRRCRRRRPRARRRALGSSSRCSRALTRREPSGSSLDRAVPRRRTRR